jgi:predicted ribosome quality control (RQC) complex YloA/Tae2 family protein
VDATLLAAAAAEVRRRAVGARVERVSQPAPATVVLHLRGADPEARLLLLCADPALARAHLTWRRRENPPVPPPFCLLLRRHLEGARLAAVEQPGLERVLYLRFAARDELGNPAEKALALQILGPRSDLALLDAQGRVLESLRRRIPPGEPYAPPPPQPGKLDPLAAGQDELRAALGRGGAADVVAGVSPRLGRALGADAGGLMRTIEEALRGRLAPPLARAWGLPPEPADEVGRACDRGFGAREDQARLGEARARALSAVLSHLQRASRKLARQEEELRQAERADELRRQGELLLCHLNAVPRGASEVRLPDIEDPAREVVVRVDPRLGAAANAQAIFRRYQKARRAQEHLERQIAATRDEVAYLAEAERAARQAETPEDVAALEEELVGEGYLRPQAPTRGRARQPARSEPLRLTVGDGWEALAGRNARQNDWLTMKAARPDDWWLHAKAIPGSHVLLRAPASRPAAEPPVEVLRRAAALAAYYSSARQGSRVPVDYTLRRHVWKPRGARPGFVLYRNERTIAVDPRGPDEGEPSGPSAGSE